MEYNASPVLGDNQLIKSYLAGNSAAFETLINLNKDKIYKSIYSVVQDKHLADDIFQDAFIRINDNLKSGKYVEEGKFLPWATRIAHNMCIDHFRKLKQAPVRNTKDGELNDAGNYSEYDYGLYIINHERNNQVRIMIDMLPDEQRDVIVLRHYANLSFKEIADLMKCNVNTALGRMRYALINLRRIIDEKQIAIN